MAKKPSHNGQHVRKKSERPVTDRTEGQLTLDTILNQYREFPDGEDPISESESAVTADTANAVPQEAVPEEEDIAPEGMPSPETDAPSEEQPSREKLHIPETLDEDMDFGEDEFYGNLTEGGDPEAEKEPEPLPESQEDEIPDEARPHIGFAPRKKKTASKTTGSGKKKKQSARSAAAGAAASAAKGLKDVRKRASDWLEGSDERRRLRKDAPLPEIEDKDKEMHPRKAVKFYSAQMPALRLRSIGAVLVSLLLIWITLACGFDWPLPGQLQDSVRLAAFVCLAGELTVMLLGLDIVTSGVLSLLRGRPGAESLLFLAAFASVIDAVVIIAAGNGARGVPYSVIPAVGITCTLIGSLHTCKGFRSTFLALYRAKTPYALTSEKLPDREGRSLIKSPHDTKGFVRRSEEPNSSETLCDRFFMPAAVIALLLSLVSGIVSKDIGAFFHFFAMLTGACAAFSWLLAYPLLFSAVSRRLQNSGSAIAGWAGARDIGTGQRTVLTDSDIFPEGTVEITGVRILDKKNTDRIVMLTGSLMEACACGTSGLFAELMTRRAQESVPVEGFTVGEGGAKGMADGVEVRVGSLSYMHLSGVKVPDKLRYESALYSAIDGEMMGLFLLKYHPVSSVRVALLNMRRAHRKPIFALRDFCVDPMLIRESFGVSVEGFEFPPYPDRYQISGVTAESESPIAGIMSRDGMDTLVELTECGTGLYRLGRLNTILSAISVVICALLVLIPGLRGNWTAGGASRLLLYMLFWLLPVLATFYIIRK